MKHFIPLLMAAMIFGAVFLNELITPEMMLGCGLILLGTALATGMLKRRVSAAAGS